MRTAICCIGKLENKYIREFVEHYQKIGFTNLILYDNNVDGGEDFKDVISDYIENGFIILKDYRNETVCQLNAYHDCYEEYGSQYDWIAFFDCDEFLELVNFNNISDFLSQEKFSNFNAILVNWKNYGDNELLLYEDKPLKERFLEPIDSDKCIAYNFPEDNHVKTIVRGDLKSINFVNPHVAYIAESCNPKGEKCKDNSSPFQTYNFEEAYLRHYSTKTIQEYCWKLKRGFPDQIFKQEQFIKFLKKNFFKTNKLTTKKLNIINKELGIPPKEFFN